jgi:hypothetical protein
VAAEQLLEGGLLTLAHKPFQQLAIRWLTRWEVTRPPQVAEKHMHGGQAPLSKMVSPYIPRRRLGASIIFHFFL